MQNRKLFVHGTVVNVCCRTEEGLPLPATPYVKTLFESALARAQALYPVIICHYLVMANHIHMILVVNNPAIVPSFVGYLKGETAHAINHLLGRQKHTIWADGYDSPIILDSDKAIDAIAYLYGNPQRANLVERIEDYPHFSSWEAFLKGGEERTVLRIPRTCIPALPKVSLSFAEQEEFANKLKAAGREECKLVIQPNAWMNCFQALSDRDPRELNQKIIETLRLNEETLKSERKKPVMGTHALKLETVNKMHEPKKRGKRMLCLSSIKGLRVAFIKWFRNLCAEAVPFGLSTDWLHSLPPGLFAPGGLLQANLNPQFVPTANTALL